MKKIKKMLYVKLARCWSKNTTENAVPSIIAENTRIKGDIIGEGIIHIDGQIEGDISCKELVVGTRGSVVGSVAADSLQLYGVLKGKAVVNSLFVAKTAKMIGDALHSTIAIEPGAYIDGNCIRQDGSSVSAGKTTPEAEQNLPPAAKLS